MLNVILDFVVSFVAASCVTCPLEITCKIKLFQVLTLFFCLLCVLSVFFSSSVIFCIKVLAHLSQLTGFKRVGRRGFLCRFFCCSCCQCVSCNCLSKRKRWKSIRFFYTFVSFIFVVVVVPIDGVWFHWYHLVKPLFDNCFQKPHNTLAHTHTHTPIDSLESIRAPSFSSVIPWSLWCCWCWRRMTSNNWEFESNPRCIPSLFFYSFRYCLTCGEEF